MIDNENCTFYKSLVALLNDFFKQDGAQRMKIFWVGVPSENNHNLEAMLSWRIELNGRQFNGNSGDDAWPCINFENSFWGCHNNHELTKKMENIIIEHSIDGIKKDNIKTIWGLTFIKDNWEKMIIENIGNFAIGCKQCEELKIVLDNHLDNYEIKSNDFFDESSSFKL